MTKKLTKKNPKEELSGWLDYQHKSPNNNRKEKKVSASLKKLQAERRRSLLHRLGFIIAISLGFIIVLGYFISPVSYVKSVQVLGANEINSNQLVKAAGLTAQDKVVSTFFNKGKYEERVKDHFPEVESINFQVKNMNGLIMQIKQRPAIGYLYEKDGYRKILSNGKLSTNYISASSINHSKPLFVGYSSRQKLISDLRIYSQLPKDIQNQIKLINGKSERSSQIVFVMKDKNIVIGNVSTIVDKMKKYYASISDEIKRPSVIDFEVGAFSRTMSDKEKKLANVDD